MIICSILRFNKIMHEFKKEKSIKITRNHYNHEGKIFGYNFNNLSVNLMMNNSNITHLKNKQIGKYIVFN